MALRRGLLPLLLAVAFLLIGPVPARAAPTWTARRANQTQPSEGGKMRRLLLALVATAALFMPATANAAAPTFVGSAQVSSWTTTTQDKTATLAVQSGDRLVAYGATETQSASLSIAGGGLTWTQKEMVNVSNYARTYLWTSTATSTGNLTITCTRSATAKEYGCGLLAYRDSDGFGASDKANNTGTPGLTLTTQHADSAVAVLSADWNAVSGTSRTWRTTDAGTAVERTYAHDSCCYTAYAATHANAGPAGNNHVGLSAPAGQKYSIVAIEIEGSTADTTPPDTTITSNPTNPTTSTSASFSFTSSESGSTFQCQLDGGGYASCTSPKSYAGPLSTGSHTFDVKATDAASNTDPTPASYTWTINSPGPQTEDCFPDPSACGFPDEDNTGSTGSLSDATTATLPSGAAWDANAEVLRITGDDVTLSDLDIPGSVTVDGDDFTLSNSKIRILAGCQSYPCGNYGIRLGASGDPVSGTALEDLDILVEDSNPSDDDPLDPSTMTVKVEHGVRNNGDLSVTADNLFIKGFSGAWKGAGTITDSYLFAQLVQSGDHVEPYLNGGEGDPSILDHNTILNPVAQTAVVSFFNDFGGIGSVEVTNNLMAGGGYIMYGGAKNGTSTVTGPIIVRDNRIARSAGSTADSHGYYPDGGSFGLWAEFNSAVTTSCDNVWDDDSSSTGNPPSSTTC